MQKLKTIALMLIMIFTLQVPAYAGTFNFTLPSGYTPPMAELTDEASIIADANSFIRSYYDGVNGDYFAERSDIDVNGNIFKIPLHCVVRYNVSDMTEGDDGLTAPMIYYEKAGGGPERDRQFLGQTKDGLTITNVRFALNANWDFLENLSWAEAGNMEAIDWWYKKGNIPFSLENLTFNRQANSDPNYAAMLDFCIGAATIQQLRNWNGQSYYISKAMANLSGNPGQPGQAVNFRPELATDFSWHKYVNILQPPTYNTWGYGIGFYRYNGSFTYKSFPIAPLRMALMPDFYPTPDTEKMYKPEYKTCAKVVTGKAGEVVNVTVSLNNSGEKAITDFKAVWFGHGNDAVGGWNSPIWQAEPKDIEVGKGEQKTFTVPVTIPQPGQETRLVFAVNQSKKHPSLERSFENNLMIIKVEPEGVDIEADLPDEPFVYIIKPGETANVYVPLIIKRNDTGETPVNVDVKYSGPFGDISKQVTLAGFSIGENITGYDIKFSTSKPGTYKIDASAWPVGVTDIKPENNTDQATVIVKLKDSPPAQKVNPDDQTRVNLRS